MKLDNLLKRVNLERWNFISPYKWVYKFDGLKILFWPVWYQFEHDGRIYRNDNVFNSLNDWKVSRAYFGILSLINGTLTL